MKLELFCVSLSLCVFLGENVVLKENGYELVVAINRDIPENREILTQLQDALTSASSYLHTTTRNYFFIKQVTILVPETWESEEWSSSSLTFREADIRVDSPHPSMGDNPYTFQPGLCGDEGRYIHLTSDFVLDNGENRDFYYGDFGRLLVHEFAHLRYGVFDEYGFKGSTKYPVGYINEEGKLKPTACFHEITGNYENMETGRPCDYIEEENDPWSEDCAFVVNTENVATSSVMFAQYLDKISDFCETDPEFDPKLLHNADAPNKHNTMCNGRGTWDVIKEHDDVKYSYPKTLPDTTPTFQMVQRQQEQESGTVVCGRRFVFVLDVSGSMTSKNRYFKLRQMADKIIRDILPVGTEVGIVVFSDNARVWADMRYLKTDTDRQTLAEGLPTRGAFSGNTAIGKGLLEGINLLAANGLSTAEGRIFLITDGEENIPPYVNTTLANIVTNDVVVHTLAYNDVAADVLNELSTKTGGQYSFFDETDDKSTQLEAAAQRLLEDVSICDTTDNSVEIDRHAVVLNSTTSSYERTVLIDPTIGNNTLFVFTLSRLATIQVSVEDPDGEVYDATSTIYTKDNLLNIIRYLFPTAKQGTWKYTLTKGSFSNEQVVAVVKSHPRTEGTLPFEVESWLGKTTYNFENQQGLAVYSYVHQGYSPIIMADVTMVVSSSTLTRTKTLMDDGILPDNTANDGVYTSYVVGFSSNSRHSLDGTVKSVEGQTAVIRAGNSFSSKAPTIYPNNTKPIEIVPVEPFTRTSSAGAVDVEGFDENVDQLDPGRVTDLEVIISDRDNREMTLTWTAPGDDLDEGTVDRYDVRIAQSFEDLRKNFSESYEILERDIKKGNITPVVAGSKQNMTISLPGHLDGDSYVFGLIAIDESNRSSDLSNLKAVTFNRIVIPGSKEDIKETAEEDVMSSMTITIIIVAAGFVVLVAIAVIVSCIVCRKSKKNPKTDSNPI